MWGFPFRWWCCSSAGDHRWLVGHCWKTEDRCSALCCRTGEVCCSAFCFAILVINFLLRAPVLVVIALIEFGGMQPLDAISVVRNQRRGAINRKQLTYLNSYKVTSLFLNEEFSHFLWHKTKHKKHFWDPPFDFLESSQHLLLVCR